jgi:hypothetical protein
VEARTSAHRLRASGGYDEEDLPTAATMSIEIDVLPLAENNEETARLADMIEGGGWRTLVV